MANKLHNLFMSKFLPSKIRTFWRTRASLRAQMVKNLPTMGRPGFDPWVGKIPWRRKWQPTPVFLPGEFHGQRSMVGYSPWGHNESDTTEWLTTHTQGSQRVRHDRSDLAWHTIRHSHCGKKQVVTPNCFYHPSYLQWKNIKKLFLF